MSLRHGVRLAVDLGQVRVGVARCDREGILASPVATLRRDTSGDTDLAEIARLALEDEALEVVVGLPVSMNGRSQTTAKAVKRWAGRLATRLAEGVEPGEPYPAVRMVDERLSSVSAHRLLHEAGRAEIGHRQVIDQVAAVVILESALDAERTSGTAPGILLTPARSSS